MSANKTIKYIIYGLLKLFIRNKPSLLPLDSSKIRSILVLRYDRLGDMIATIPLLNFIAEKLPECKIDILCSKGNRQIAQHCGPLNDIHTLTGKLNQDIITINRLRKRRYDLILPLVWKNTTKSGIISNLVSSHNSKKINAAHDCRSKEYDFFFNSQIDISDIRFKAPYAILLCLFTARIFGWDEALKSINGFCHSHKSFNIPRQNIEKAIVFRSSVGGRFCLVNVSASSAHRMLSAEQYSILLKELSCIHPEWNFILTGAPEHNSFIENMLTGISSNVIHYRTTNDFMDVCALTQISDAVISPNTSIVHVAAAFDRPLLMLTPLDELQGKEWMPLSKHFACAAPPDGLNLNDLDLKDAAKQFSSIITQINY